MPDLRKIIKLTQEQYDTLAEGGTVGSYTGLDSNFLYLVQEEEESSVTTLMTALTYASLKALKQSGELIPGMQYRITDYVSVVSVNYANTQSVSISTESHPFDVIVTADDASTLNHMARAIKRSNDTYFTSAGEDLSKWRIWYDINNDTNKYAWADSTNGKGVIYRMIDEHENDIPFDFKSIKIGGHYVFRDDSNSNVDASLASAGASLCYRNKVGFYEKTTGKLDIASNMFRQKTHDNEIGAQCYGNLIQKECVSNHIGNECHDIGLGPQSSYNEIKDKCYSISMSWSNTYNVFDGGCHDITFNSNCYGNTFGARCYSITTHDYVRNCTFSPECFYIKFGNSSATIDFVQHCRFEYCKYLYLDTSDSVTTGSRFVQLWNIHKGVGGSSTSNRVTILVPDRVQAYSTDVYKDNHKEIYV